MSNPDSPTITWSKIVLHRPRKDHPTLQTTGFAKSLRALATGPDDLEYINDEIQGRIVPDAFVVDESKMTMTVWEIEDTHPMPPHKIGEYYTIFDEFDVARGWDCKLIVLDRYGLNPQSIPVFQLGRAYNFLLYSERDSG